MIHKQQSSFTLQQKCSYHLLPQGETIRKFRDGNYNYKAQTVVFRTSSFTSPLTLIVYCMQLQLYTLSTITFKFFFKSISYMDLVAKKLPERH